MKRPSDTDFWLNDAKWSAMHSLCHWGRVCPLQFWKFRVTAESKWCHVVMVEAEKTFECILHPNWTCIRCVNTFQWWLWAYECTLTLRWFHLTFQIWFHKCIGNSMVGAPYSHPQHIMFGNHLVYVWNGCGNHSMWDESLIHCMMVSFDTQQWSVISADFLNPIQQVWW
jgi:hypothetical protein